MFFHCLYHFLAYHDICFGCFMDSVLMIHGSDSVDSLNWISRLVALFLLVHGIFSAVSWHWVRKLHCNSL